MNVLGRKRRKWNEKKIRSRKIDGGNLRGWCFTLFYLTLRNIHLPIASLGPLVASIVIKEPDSWCKLVTAERSDFRSVAVLQTGPVSLGTENDWHLGWNIRELAHGRQALAFRVKGTSRHVFSHFLPPLPHRFVIGAIKVLVAASLCRIVGSESMMPTGILFISWLRSGLQWQIDVVVTLLAWIDLFILTEALRGCSYCMQKNVRILIRLNYV